MHSRPEHPAVSMPKPHGPGTHGKKPSARLPVPAHGPMAHGKPHSARLPRATHSRHATTDMFNVHHHGRKANWWFVAGCSLFMICYFLPWFSAGGGSLLGFEVSYYVPRFLRAVQADGGMVLASNSLWIFAFIGVWALFALGDEFTGMRRKKNRWWLRLVTAMAPLIALVFVIATFAMLGAQTLAEIGSALADMHGGAGAAATTVLGILGAVLGMSSFGLWAMFIAMVLCGISIAVHPKNAAAHAHGPVPAAAH